MFEVDEGEMVRSSDNGVTQGSDGQGHTKRVEEVKRLVQEVT